MAKAVVTICCWRKGHLNELALTKRQEETLARKISKSNSERMLAVCPDCREDGNHPIFIHLGQTVFSPSKLYTCRHGHATAISAFSSGMLHVKFGSGSEDFVNIEGTIEELEELISTKDISCHHVKENGRVCDCKLKPADDSKLSYPQAAGIKTRTRVGDLWDKAGIEPVRTGQYDKSGDYHESRTQKANQERLKRMRRERNSEKHPGRRIDKATDTDYGRRSKSEVNPERLKGPQ